MNKKLSEHQKYLNREISWLYFNQRVLHEAANEEVPLWERIRFLGIFSNNTDEFFRVRVATLRRLATTKSRKFEKFDIDPKKLLSIVNTMVKEQQKTFISIFRSIVTQLNKQNVIILNETQVKHPQHLAFLQDFYENELRIQIFPIMLSNLHSKAILRDENPYLAILLRKTSHKNQKEDYALIEIPANVLPRFVVLPNIGDNKLYIILLDDVIRLFLTRIFSMLDYDTFEAYTIKITRDSELDIEQDISKSFIDRIEESLKQRYTGVPVRLVYDKKIPKKLLNLVLFKLQISSDDIIIPGGRYHNFKDFMNFPKFGDDKNYFPKLEPLPHPELMNAKRIIDVLDKKDILLSFPYHSFSYVIDFLREASIHPEVRSIRMTVYRIAPNSRVMNALINAARNGKHVTVFMELQARFDERTNIFWSQRLLEEGITIQHSFPGLKVHSKLIQIRRQKDNKDIFYTLIGTGNFNESTAQSYSDCILMTSDKDIGEDVRKVFELFETVYKPVKFKKIYVSPFTTRIFIRAQLSRLIQHARKNLPAECIIKVNNLSDKDTIDLLYKASQAGVKIHLIVRSICSLIPQLPGYSENIQAISIVDRFLEHARIFYFKIGDKEEVYISSADFMMRNLDHRVEVTCPVLQPDLVEELKQYLFFQLQDNTKARYHTPDGSQIFVTNNLPPSQAQVNIYNYYLSKLKFKQ